MPRPRWRMLCHSSISQVHTANGEHDENSESMGLSPLPFFFAIKHCLFGSDIIMLFCKSTDSSADRTAGSKGISTPRICICVYNDKTLPFLMEWIPCKPSANRNCWEIMPYQQFSDNHCYWQIMVGARGKLTFTLPIGLLRAALLQMCSGEY